MSLICGHIYVYHCNWINPPHDKLAICIQASPEWVFWFNSRPRPHGQGQLQIDVTDHPAAIKYPCFLDLAQVKAMSPREAQLAQDRGAISSVFRAKVITALGMPITLLSPAHQAVALANL